MLFYVIEFKRVILQILFHPIGWFLLVMMWVRQLLLTGLHLKINWR